MALYRCISGKCKTAAHNVVEVSKLIRHSRTMSLEVIFLIKIIMFSCFGAIMMTTSSNGNIFRGYWPCVRGIHRSPVNPLHKGQWRGALMFSMTCAWINGWVNNCEIGDLRRHRAHYDVAVMIKEDRLYNDHFISQEFGASVCSGNSRVHDNYNWFKTISSSPRAW